ncbi:MAG: hypothetical protein WB439_17080 [Acidobacteriaceae bacterium]
MLTLLYCITQIYFIAGCIRQEERAGVWSLSKFFFSFAFMALEWLILYIPLAYIPALSHWHTPGIILASILFCLNFIWFILVCRRWPLPGRNTTGGSRRGTK